MNKTLRTQRGFTLVELMISLVLGLLIILALLTMLINVNRNNSELSSTNRLIENGRFSLQLLTSDVSHSGYWAGHVPEFDDLTGSTTVGPTDVPTGVPDPCLAFSAANWTDEYKKNMVGIAAQGTDIPAIVPSPTTPFCSSVVTNPQPSTDVLVVRHAEPCLVGSGTDDCSDTRANASPHLYFQASRCDTDTASFVLDTSAFTLKAGNCTADAPVRRFSSSIYFVRNYANSVGDGIPTLARARFGVINTAVAGNVPEFLSAQALVEGVQGFRVEYGVDNRSDTAATVDLAALALPIAWPTGATVLNTPTNRGNGMPDEYIRCSQATPCSADQLVNVTAVKLYVLVRAERTTPGHRDTKQYCLASSCTDLTDYMGPFNDGYKRHLFTQTIRLTNVATRRETP
ncbi:MAG: PilW family protein [Burkholderiaceae bacterium]|nr:PilW family protein [Burkholderiaceae bacterium]